MTSVQEKTFQTKLKKTGLLYLSQCVDYLKFIELLPLRQHLPPKEGAYQSNWFLKIERIWYCTKANNTPNTLEGDNVDPAVCEQILLAVVNESRTKRFLFFGLNVIEGVTFDGTVQVSDDTEYEGND